MQAAAQALQIQDELPETKALHASIAAALLTTLLEPAQKKAWTMPRTRRLVVLALLRHKEEDALICLHNVLGEVVNSDLRRWEDLREELLDESLDLMHISETLAAVAAM